MDRGLRRTSSQQRHLVDVRGTALVNRRKTRIHRREHAAGSRINRVSKSAPLCSQWGRSISAVDSGPAGIH
ncbi:hypothetical protein GDO81_019460 [Engystomops pustulosus]|uniref:Uncharacterized protein n=1 Tax=Engystomops pustulosus TaxID=76066 RepID=A0AAV6YB35_ENGPU|nr:hypothetical protein GDO81_019460 [Engystomops pustulosus]